MRERILAVVGALVLIAAALVARSFLAGDSDNDHSAGGENGRDRPVVACTPDLEPVCDALVAEGVITAAPSSLDLSGAAAPPDGVAGWITWAPAPGVANIDRPDTWLPGGEPVASAPIGVLVADGGQCQGAPTWASCVIAAATDGLPVGVGPGNTAESLARLEPLARALVPDDGDFTTISGAALRRVLTSPQVPQEDQRSQITMMLTRRGTLSLVIGPVPALQKAASRHSVARVVVPTPAARMTVVLATRQVPGQEALAAQLVLDSQGAAAAFNALGVAPGPAEAPLESLAGEMYAVFDKIR